jgi:CRISPR/Cas system-associated exonuclease Cas4 (RecB family)
MISMPITQGHLKLLETCPRRFQYSYLEHIPVPTAPAVLERQQWGTQFHLVMQQRELGLSVDAILAETPELELAVNRLLAAARELFQPPQPDEFRQSEHRRQLAFNDYLLTVIYDLLIMTPHQAHIVDWKTYQRPPKQAQLTKDWQTRLYLYVLVETSHLSPEQVSMSYWFVRPQPGSDQASDIPSQTRIPYSTAQHRKTEKDLQRLTDYLTTLLAPGTDLPQVDVILGHCDRCPFAVRCQRPSVQYDIAALLELPSIEEIEEVPL